MPASFSKFPSVRFPALLLAVWLAACPFVRAQGVQDLLKAFGANTTQSGVRQASAAEQLEWARGELAKSQAAFDEKREAALAAQIRIAGLPDDRIEEFRTAARETARNFQSAVEVLESLPKLEPESSQVQPTASPANEKAAAALRDTLRRSNLAAKSAAGEMELLDRMADQFAASSAVAARQIRQFGEESASAKSEESKARAEVQLELARLRMQAADATVFYAKWKQYQKDLVRAKALAQANAARSALRASGFDRQIDDTRSGLQLAAVADELSKADTEIAEAVKDQARADDIRKETATESAQSSAVVRDARLAAADALADAAQGRVAALQSRHKLLEMEKNHWTSVQSLAKAYDPAISRAATVQAEESLRMLGEWRPQVDRLMLEARENLESAQRQLKTTRHDAALKGLLEKLSNQNRQRIESLAALLSRGEHLATLQTEFLAELQSVAGSEGTRARLGNAWRDALSFLGGIWGFELFASGQHGITIGKVLLGIVGLLLSVSLARSLSEWGARSAARNFRLDNNRRIIFQKALFVPLVATLVLMILNWLNIPLTLFAFFGGALAIGFGFGAQNLVNNFISGIILLLERQVKVGDILEVGSSTGKITHLGSRCSRLRRFDGVEVLIPNSTFLETSVINWTLADHQHRFEFTVGAAYGSPVEKVLALLQTALREDPDVLSEPPPAAYFEAFGDSALVFRLYYWCELGGETDARLVGSRIRCRIDREFREVGIEMPFPQRDLRIRTSEPIPVVLARTAPAGATE